MGKTHKEGSPETRRQEVWLGGWKAAPSDQQVLMGRSMARKPRLAAVLSTKLPTKDQGVLKMSNLQRAAGKPPLRRPSEILLAYFCLRPLAEQLGWVINRF